MSPRKTDRRGFLKRVGVLSTALIAAAAPNMKDIVTDAIDSISTADDVQPQKRVPVKGEQFTLYPGENTKCLNCDTLVGVDRSYMLSTYGGKETKEGKESHIFLLDIPFYCRGCNAKIGTVTQTDVTFVVAEKDNARTEAT